MKRFGLNTLRIKILVPPVLATAILLLSPGGGTGLRIKATLSADLASKAESMAASLEKVGIPYILNLDYASLEGIVAQAVEDPEVEFVVYYDAKGKVLTRNSQKKPISEDALFWEREIKDPSSQAIIGRMKCAFSPRGLGSQLRQDLITIAAALGGGGLMVVMTLVCVIRRRTKPSNPAMDEIVESSKQVAVASPSLRPRRVIPLGKADLKLFYLLGWHVRVLGAPPSGDKTKSCRRR